MNKRLLMLIVIVFCVFVNFVRPINVIAGDETSVDLPNGEIINLDSDGEAIVPQEEPKTDGEASIPQEEPKATGEASVPQEEPKADGEASVPQEEPKVAGEASVPQEVPKADGEASVPQEEPKATGEASVPQEEPKATGEASVPQEEPKTDGKASVLKKAPTGEDQSGESLRAVPNDEQDIEELTRDETTDNGNDFDIQDDFIYEIQKVKVYTSKVAEDNETPVVGAVLQIIDADGNVVDEWTSDDKAHLTLLTVGTYTIHEVKAPDGYILADDVELIVELPIVDLVGGVDYSNEPCPHNMGTTSFYVKINGVKYEVYCINQNWETPDGTSEIYDGLIITPDNIRNFTQQTIPVKIKDEDVREVVYQKIDVAEQFNDPEKPDKTQAEKNLDLYNKILDIIYRRNKATDYFEEQNISFTINELRMITEVALKNYTNPGLAELQYGVAKSKWAKMDAAGVEYKIYSTSTYAATDYDHGNRVSYLKHNYRDFKYIPSEDGTSYTAPNDYYGQGDSFGQMVASHWLGNGHIGTDGITDEEKDKLIADVARYYKLFQYLTADNGEHHPENMQLYIFSTDPSSGEVSPGVSNNNHDIVDGGGVFQNLLGVTGYYKVFEEIEINKTIVNKYSTEKTSVTVKKVWDDNDNQDGKRPTELTVKLSNGQSVTLNEENNWAATIENLPKYDKGKEIKYTWTEDEKGLPEGYKLTNTKVEGYVTTLTNSYTPEVVEVTIKKVWDDNDNQDGIRPNELTVTLSNGDKVTLNEKNGWTATIENLPKYSDGKEIKYTWTEDEKGLPEGYKLTNTKVEGYVTTLTNSYTPEVVEVTIKKVWDDNDNQDGIRPNELTVTLSNGQSVTLNEENNWTATIKNLPKYDKGKEIKYTWTEADIKDYTLIKTEVDGYITTLTNQHTPEVRTLSVLKVWADDDDEEKKRPKDITITLLANGKEYDTIVLTEEGEWKYEFKNLPVYNDGEKITYTVREDVVPKDYEVAYEETETGFIIHNVKGKGGDEPPPDDNPQTGSNIVLYLLMLFVSIIGLASGKVYLKETIKD